MIKAVLTDLDGVVRKWDPEIIQPRPATSGGTRHKGLYISNPDKYIGEILALNRV